MLLDLKGNLKKAAEDSSRKNEAEFNHSCCEVKLYIEGPSKKSRPPMYNSVLEGHAQVLACMNSLTSEGQNGAHLKSKLKKLRLNDRSPRFFLKSRLKSPRPIMTTLA